MDSEVGTSGAMKIICRSGKLMGNNRRPMAIILLFFLLSRYLLFCPCMIIVGKLERTLVDIFEMSRTEDPASILGAIIDGLGSFILPVLIIMLAYFLRSLLLSLTVLHTVNMVSEEKKVTLKSTLIEIREKLKSVVVTRLYVWFLYQGFMNFSLFLILAVLLLGAVSVVFYFLSALMVISSLVLVVYLDFVWFLGVVVSIMETDCEGLTALGKSTAAVVGRRALAFRVSLLLNLVVFIVESLNAATINLAKGGIGIIVVDFTFCGILLLLEICSLAVLALFYQECRSKAVDEQGTQERLFYSKVSQTVPPGEDIH